MYSVGEKIIYGENGVCTVEAIAPLGMSGTATDKLYYHLRPLIGSGMYFSPIDSNAFMRPVITREEAEALIDSIPSIEPAVCMDSRFNHVDAFYKEIFKLHTPEALVSIIKGLKLRAMEKKTKSSKAESSMKRAKEMLYGEISVALGIAYNEVEKYILERSGEA
ncbi:MAG: CarD family transcriptional regulator [Eubacteriales bacterium]|nr:CarD family transcriptional regulator [Eubacteriales bacterium]